MFRRWREWFQMKQGPETVRTRWARGDVDVSIEVNAEGNHVVFASRYIPGDGKWTEDHDESASCTIEEYLQDSKASERVYGILRMELSDGDIAELEAALRRLIEKKKGAER